MSLGYTVLSSAEPFWHCFFSEVSSKVGAVFICDLMRAASVVAESRSKAALAFGISCPYSEFLWHNDKVILAPFLGRKQTCVLRTYQSW